MRTWQALRRSWPAASRQAPAARIDAVASIQIHGAREHNLQEHRCRAAAQPLHGRDRRVRLGQVDARVRHRVRRRTAPLSRVAERVRASVRAAGIASRRRCDLRHSADGRDRAAHQPRRPQEHGRDADRDLSLPAPALREARHAVLPGLRRADRAAELRVHRARVLKDYRGKTISVLAPLVVRARVTTRTWPRGRRRRATRTCASTANCCRRTLAAPVALPGAHDRVAGRDAAVLPRRGARDCAPR